MKKIVVTGKNGGVSRAFCAYMRRYPGVRVESLSLRGDAWRAYDLSGTNAIFHCAGLVAGEEEELFAVNAALTSELYEAAVRAGVERFVYLSSMAVYDFRNTHAANTGVIDLETPCAPQTAYGRSKLEAERRLALATCPQTPVAVIRAPSIVGQGVEGDFARYMRAFALPFFPAMFTDRKRGFLYIDSLCELARLIVEEGGSGVYLPQNEPALSVVELLEELALATGQKLRLLRLPRWMWVKTAFTTAHFGDCRYTAETSNCYGGAYRKISAREAVRLCTGKKEACG